MKNLLYYFVDKITDNSHEKGGLYENRRRREVDIKMQWHKRTDGF